jgi:hypothetical protein
VSKEKAALRESVFRKLNCVTGLYRSAVNVAICVCTEHAAGIVNRAMAMKQLTSVAQPAGL